MVTVTKPGADHSTAQISLGQLFFDDLRFYSSLRHGRGPAILLSLFATLCNPGLWLLTSHRLTYLGKSTRRPLSATWWLAQIWLRFGLFFSAMFWRSDIARDCQVAQRVYLPNGGHLICGAISIGSGTIIHSRCTFGQAVSSRTEGRPVIGRDVWIGPNCVIAGGITIGDGATILPNTFLTFSVHPRTVVQGNPGRVVSQGFDNRGWRQSLTIFNAISADEQ